MTAWVSQSLGPEHDVVDFDCGNATLHQWLVTQARRSDTAGATRTYVWTVPGETSVVAYFAIAPTQVRRTELPSRGLAGGYSTVPGYLIARLALSQVLHGSGLGTELLIDALGRIVQASTIGGGRLIIVDALDDRAHQFYRHHDFIPVTDSRRLYLKVATAAAALEAR